MMISKEYISCLEYNRRYERLSFDKLLETTKEEIISTQATIQDITEPKFVTTTTIFACRHCGSPKPVHTQYPFKIPKVPKEERCEYCNHKKGFTIDLSHSEYHKIQTLTLTSENTTQTIQAILSDEQCSNNYKPHDKIQIKAVLTMVQPTKNTISQLLQIYTIQLIAEEQEDPTEQETTDNNRNTPGYNDWVTKIQKRDKVCQCCGGNKHLEAHHMYNYKNHPKLRLDEGNGILLCTFCHNKFHSYYGVTVTPADLVKFLYRFGGR